MKWANAEHSMIQDGSKDVPVDSDNRLYREILERVAAGETIDPFVAPVPSAAQLLAEAKAKAERAIDEVKLNSDINDPRYNTLPEVIDYRNRRP